MAEYAIKGDYGQIVSFAFVLLFGWLAKRAINDVDKKINDNRTEVDKLRTEVDAKIEAMADSIRLLTATLTTAAIENKEVVGEINSDISYIRA